ncbi:hypothetical protein [Halarsenatibacter silvermanii]|uniref:Uncharacterized protein n=1 Tax=Halarsenatibacter silvermanii TaxID=321763 RepID=A0A1G9RBB9_9FIRM|nr:hypothetical protein [Halarsenatibacter silvermanii]SDM20533.1 hypothetical protein SAMN04488692_12126 [Halarsenatibacter silvermanii]
MTLQKKVSEEVEFAEVLKSKHARYIHGAVISKEEVVADYVAPGVAIGKITESGHDEEGKFSVVTRGEVASGGVTHGADTIEVEEEADLYNFAVGDEVDIVGADGESQSRSDNDLTIVSIDAGDKLITVEDLNEDAGSEDYSSVAYVEKADGSSKAKFICLNLIDVSEEDAIVGGITHGAVFKDRMVNYDEKVAEDLAAISFEGEAVQGEQV